MERRPFLSMRRKEPARLALRMFPIERTDGQDALDELEAYLQEGYGAVVLYNHFSKSDHVRAISEIILEVPTVSRRPILSPIAVHQYDFKLKALSRLTRVKLMPLSTPNTEEEHPEMVPDERARLKMMMDYTSKAKETLSSGGLVFLAPQAQRKGKLGEPLPGKPLKRILKGQSSDKLVFLFAGLEIPGVTDYWSQEARGYSRGRIFNVTFGKPVTYKELMERCEGDINSVDQAAFDYLRQIVPPEYLD